MTPTTLPWIWTSLAKIGSISLFAGWSRMRSCSRKKRLRDDDIPVAGGRLGLHDHIVAVVDQRVDHALASHPQHVRPVTCLDGARHVQGFRGVRVRLDGLAGGDLAEDGQRYDVALDRHAERRHARRQTRRALALRPGGQAQGAGAVASAFEQAVSFQRDQVVMNGGGGGEADGIRDLAHRRGIATLDDGVGDALEDLLSTVDVVPGHLAGP